MGVNKVVFGAVAIMDISDSTVTEDTLAEGAVAYGADGERITGTMKASGGGGQYCWKKYEAKKNYTVTSELLGTTEPEDLGSTSYQSYTITDDGYFQLVSGFVITNAYSLPSGATNGKTKYIYFKAWKSTISGSYYNYSKLTLSDTYTETKGDFLGYVTSDDSSAYPGDGTGADGYWYVLVSDSQSDVTTVSGVEEFTLASDATTSGTPVKLGNIPFIAEHINDANLFVALVRKDTIKGETYTAHLAVSCNSAYLYGGYFMTMYRGPYLNLTTTDTSLNYALNSATGSNQARVYADSNGDVYVLPYGSSTTNVVKFIAGTYSVIYGLL